MVDKSGFFFIYDHSYLKKEDDYVGDAVMYFYPPALKIENELFCGQLMGMVGLFESLVESPPILFRLSRLKIAHLKRGLYSMCYGEPREVSDESLIDKLSSISLMIDFYFKGTPAITNEPMVQEISTFLNALLPTFLNKNDAVTTTPLAITDNATPEFYLKGMDLLHFAQSLVASYLGGMVLYKNRIVCLQLISSLKTTLQLTFQYLPHFTSKVDISYQPPKGVCILPVWLSNEQLSQLATEQMISTDDPALLSESDPSIAPADDDDNDGGGNDGGDGGDGSDDGDEIQPSLVAALSRSFGDLAVEAKADEKEFELSRAFLFVQSNSDMAVLFLSRSDSDYTKENVFQLWEGFLASLAALDISLKSVTTRNS